MLITLSACDASVTNDAAEVVPDLTRTAATQVQLDSLGAIRMGDAGESPLEVNRVLVAGERVYVLDAPATRVSGYHRNGRLIFSLKYRTKELPIRSPIMLRALDARIFLLDVDESRGMAILTQDGELERMVSLREVGSASVDALVVDGYTAVATAMDAKAIRTGRATIVAMLDSSGQVAGRGCYPDPVYRESVERNGLTRSYRAFGLAVQGSRVFCRQPVSPAIQILDKRGNAIGALRRVPPFYRPPVDRRGFLNEYDRARFRSTWNEHLDFYPTPTGFISVYSTFDTLSGGSRYDLFACDSALGPVRCGTAVSRGKPITIIPPDTLVILAPLEGAADPPVLILTRLRL